jgi:hypothetical protein
MIELQLEYTVGYGLDNCRIVVQFPEEANDFSLFLYSVKRAALYNLVNKANLVHNFS